MIIKYVTGRLAFGELEESATLVPILEFFFHYEDKTHKKFSILKGTYMDEEKFIEKGKQCLEDMEQTLTGKEYDENEIYSLLNKHHIIIFR